MFLNKWLMLEKFNIFLIKSESSILAVGGTASFCFVTFLKKKQNKRYSGTRVS